MAKKLFITDERMLRLKDWAIENNIARTETEYWKMIGFPRTSLSNVMKGSHGFTKSQILNACKVTGASADFIFGLDPGIKRKQPKKAVEMLRDAVVAVEIELRQK
jgi:hypothetical protein